MKKLTIILTSCLIVVSMLALPIETRAKTISQFEAEAEKYMAGNKKEAKVIRFWPDFLCKDIFIISLGIIVL